MASEMVERVAVALSRCAFGGCEDAGDIRACQFPPCPCRTAAIAAIRAMREPTKAMSVTGGLAFEDAAFGEGKLVFDGAASAWRAMVDQIMHQPAQEASNAP